MVTKKKQLFDTCQIENKRIKNFLNTEVKSYALYVLQTRTMPNIMDGLRVGARKVLWAALTGDLSKKKFVKMPALIGDTMKLQYQHGDASLANTIVGLCCKHLNKYCPLEAIGQIPSLRVPSCDTAVRYLMIRKSKYLQFYSYDKELLEIQEEEGERIEPKYFLPIIPLVLLNRTSSPGFGFSFKSFSYRLEDIIDNIILSIGYGTCEQFADRIPLKPEIVGVNPDNIIWNASKGKWYCVGEYNMNYDTDQMIVTDLPFNVSFEKFETVLQTLKDKFIIKDWTNTSEKENIKYIITFSNGRLRGLFEANRWKFFKIFCLYSPIPNDILNCMDEDGTNIMFFENPYSLIDTFVKKRLKYYSERKTRTIQRLKEQLEIFTKKIEFIKLVISEDIVVLKRKKSEIKQDLNKYGIPEYVLDMKIWNLSEEEILDLESKHAETKAMLEYIENTTIQEMYVNDLIEFRNEYISA